MKETLSVKTTFIIGFMLFSTFFGAGNLIFPPYLGVVSGSEWVTGFLGFLIGDVILAVLAVIAYCKYDDVNTGILTRCGHRFAAVMSTIMVLCLGPCVVIPRTASTTFEIGILPWLSGGRHLLFSVVFSVLFFTVVWFLTIRPSKVADYVGKFLTPTLLIMLFALILKGIVTPLGEIRPGSLAENTLGNGLTQGYQTFDCMGGVLMAILVVTAISSKGIDSKEQRLNTAARSGLIAAVFLALIYGGLCYLGATVSSQFDTAISQPALLVTVTEMLFGKPGSILLGIIVALACLTTAAGLGSAACSYMTTVFKGKLKYETMVTVLCVFSAVISNFGVSKIIAMAVPVLTVIYPVIVSCIFLSLFTDQIKKDGTFRLAAWTALICGLLSAMKVPFMSYLPFAQTGLAYVVPTLIAAAAGFFLPDRSSQSRM